MPSPEQPAAASDQAVVDGPTIRSLTVIAGPTAVGKTRLLKTLAADEELRERLSIPVRTPALTAGGFLRLDSPDPIDALVLHYDILRPAPDADPGTVALGSAEAISFLTLRTTLTRLAAQLDRRIAGHPDPPKKLRRLRPLYDDERFVADWYERWFAFVEQFREVTVGNYLVDANDGYRRTPFLRDATSHGT
jgi:hypothetical protein